MSPEASVRSEATVPSPATDTGNFKGSFFKKSRPSSPSPATSGRNSRLRATVLPGSRSSLAPGDSKLTGSTLTRRTALSEGQGWPRSVPPKNANSTEDRAAFGCGTSLKRTGFKAPPPNSPVSIPDGTPRLTRRPKADAVVLDGPSESGTETGLGPLRSKSCGISKKSSNGLRNRTPERAAEEVKYRQAAKQYLSAHRFCARCLLSNRLALATEIHHLAGREHGRLLDERFWTGLCSACHWWTENEVAEARTEGFVQTRQISLDKLLQADDFQDLMRRIGAARAKLKLPD